MSNILSISAFKNVIEKFYSGIDVAHTKEHILRVYNNVKKIAIHINLNSTYNISIDDDVLISAAILHDICRNIEKSDHAIEGSELAYDLLSKRNDDIDFNLNLSVTQIDNVVNAIKTHRFSRNQRPYSIEGAILQDADRLDNIGATGIVRCISYSVKNGIPIYNPDIPPSETYNEYTPQTTAINHMIEKLMKINEDSFHFEYSKEQVRKSKNLLESFIDSYVYQNNFNIN